MVYALVPIPNPSGGTYSVANVVVVAQNLSQPNGLAVIGTSLYVATTTDIIKFNGIDDINSLANKTFDYVYRGTFPNNGNFTWHYLTVGPDDNLYASIGSPCDNCIPNNSIQATIVKLDRKGNYTVYARGVRFSMGMAFHPQTHDLWFTDNAHDADPVRQDDPFDELNVATGPNENFGYPYCHDNNQPDENNLQVPNQTNNCTSYIAPVLLLGQHIAPLGMKFYTGSMFPVSYQNAIIVAERGSADLSTPVGFQIATVYIQNGKYSYKPFIKGWLNAANTETFGRVVDILVLPDGSILISDDTADVIYRVSYVKPN